MVHASRRLVAERKYLLRPPKINVSGGPVHLLMKCALEAALAVCAQKSVIHGGKRDWRLRIPNCGHKLLVLYGINRGREVEIEADRSSAPLRYRRDKFRHPSPVNRNRRREICLFEALRIDHDESDILMGLIETL